MSGTNTFEMELQALKSIYDNDLHIEGDTLTIRVHPLQNEDKKNGNIAEIDFEVNCPTNYPQMIPAIALKNCKGLSNKKINLLMNELKDLMKSLQGKPMIYDLACHILNYLLDNTRPVRKSFYDEMICRKKQEEEKFKSDEDRRKRKIYDVQKKVQLKIREGNSSEDDFDESHTSKNDRHENKINGSSCEKTEKQISCNPSTCSSSKYIQFESKVLRGCCLEHRDSSIVYSGLDTGSGDQLIIHEWILKPNQYLNETERILRSIQNEFNYLKILRHENLNFYVDYKCISDKDEWTVYIAENYVSDITLKTFIKHNWPFDLDFVQSIVEGILRALLFLHDHKVVHKHLNEAHIHFCKSGKVILAGCSLIKRMDDLFKLCNGEVRTDVKADQNTDIMQLGLVLKTLLEFISKTNDIIQVSSHKFLEFKDFIKKCLIKNEERRWGARELLDHNFLKKYLLYEASEKRKPHFPKLSFEENDEVQSQFDFSLGEQNSRLLKDFCVLEDIGKGSFGKVLKVRNKLDGQIYAIKEIKLDKNSQPLDKKIIGEVKLLSKLKHENVVRYYTSWIESYSGTESLQTESADKSKEEEDDNEDSEDDDDDDDLEDTSDPGFWQKNDQKDGSSFIVFERDEKSSSSNASPKKEMGVNNIPPVRIMYIQMEFCEKSTLKYAIKNNLHQQELRCWRLLREIVEGLTYIHEQGLIHRDLKPDNIFLDSNDHVKIGDFGLAKIRGMSKSTLVITEVSLGGGDVDNSQYTQGGSDTVGVGTSYYVAPEMSRSFEKSHYNEKVDIYSLGIIFFEMCHPPFNTGMERHDVLTKLRKPEIIIPASMEEKMHRQMELVRMLLNRDPALRPSSQEILEDRVPPAEIEFEELKEIVRKTLNSPETKGYKYLISSCLSQKMSIDEDITYQLQNFHSDKFHVSLEMAKEPIENIFKNHGAVYMSTPLLLPQNEVYANIDTRVKLMTQSGSVVNLPYDLRVPFARYVISKNIRRFRRYTVDRVHREQKMHGLIPKELYECAFDIVSPKIGNLADEWEIFCVMSEVVSSIPSLKNRNCVIILNHALILRALLIYCNVEKLYSEIFKFLMEAKVNKHGTRQLETNLLSLELGTQVVSTLVTYFAKEESAYVLKEELLSLFNNRTEAYEKAEKGLEILIKINEEAKNLGVNIPIRLRLGVVCNSEYCSDIMFDLVCKTRQKRGKQCNEVIMSGCRYDGLLKHFRKKFSFTSADSRETSHSAIGVSISLDKIASILKEDNVLTEHVVVCSTDHRIPNELKTSFIKELHDSKIKCYFEDSIDNMEELLEYCEENKITHIVNLKEENGLVLVMSWDSGKRRYREKKLSKREVAEYIQKNSKLSEDQLIANFQRSESKTSSGEVSATIQSFNIHVLTEEKSLTRRKYENHIRSKISPLLRNFSSKVRVEVVGVDLDESEISRLAMLFKFDDSSYMSKILASVDSYCRRIISGLKAENEILLIKEQRGTADTRLNSDDLIESTILKTRSTVKKKHLCLIFRPRLAVHPELDLKQSFVIEITFRYFLSS